MKRRRALLFAIVTGALGSPLALMAQPAGKVPRVGFLISETLSGQASRVEALRAGLRERGYVEGRNIEIQFRPADGLRPTAVPDLAVGVAS